MVPARPPNPMQIDQIIGSRDYNAALLTQEKFA